MSSSISHVFLRAAKDNNVLLEIILNRLFMLNFFRNYIFEQIFFVLLKLFQHFSTEELSIVISNFTKTKF